MRWTSILQTLLLLIPASVCAAGPGNPAPEGAPVPAVESGEENELGGIRLVIWDETDDRRPGNRVRYEGDIVRFYAFYGRGEKPVRDPSVTCIIRSRAGAAPMKFDEKLGLFRFERKAQKAGTYSWSVRCGGGSYPELEQTDRVEILSLKEDLYRQLVNFEETYDFRTDPAKTKQPGAFPRLLNRFNLNNRFLDEDFRGMDLNRKLALALSRWDVVVPQLYNVTPSNVKTHVEIHRMIKEYNPRTKLLMYIPGGSFPVEGRGVFAGELVRMFSGNGWFARTSNGTICRPGGGWGLLQYAPGPSASRYAGFIAGKMKTYSYFDGVWLDLIRGERVISRWCEEDRFDIDLDRDGLPDVDQHGTQWVVDNISSGFAKFLKELREDLGDDMIIVGNPGVPWEINEKYDDSEYFEYANGNMKEGAEAPEYVISKGVEGALLNEKRAHRQPQRMFVILLANRDPDHVDRRRMRYALTMTLMTNAYFAFDSKDVDRGGHRWHNQVYWWPEYNVDLGFPVAGHRVMETEDGRHYYFREYEKGVVVANRGNRPLEITFDDTYRDVSTGAVTSTFTIGAGDGRILVLPEAPER